MSFSRVITTISPFILSFATCGMPVTGIANEKNLNRDQREVVLYYETRGKGAPIILLHGFGGNIYSWRHLIEPLSKDHELILIDLKGFGKSPKPHDKYYEVRDQAELIYKFIVAHKLTNLTLIGHSLGGGVALLTALKLLKERTGSLRQLVLIDTAAYKQDLPDFINVLRTPVLGPLITSIFSDKQKVRMILKKAYYDDSQITEDQVTAYAAPLRSAGGRYALIRTAKLIIPADIQQISDTYKDISVPTLILWGRQDKIVPLQIGQHLHKDIASSELIVIENCGHIPHEERPKDAVNAISRFLRGPSSIAKPNQPK
jgi:pimeloyl-ACP methyl ester carboxylesterase